MNETILHRLQNQHFQINFLLQGLRVDFLQKRHRPNKWSIHENLAHLGRYQEVFLQRIARILKENQPQFGRYKAEQDELFEKWLQLPTPIILDKIQTHRKIIVEKLLQLKEKQTHKTGTHPKLGMLDISEWTEFFLLHEQHHFCTIFWLIHEYK